MRRRRHARDLVPHDENMMLTYDKPPERSTTNCDASMMDQNSLPLNAKLGKATPQARRSNSPAQGESLLGTSAVESHHVSGMIRADDYGNMEKT